MAQPAKSSHRQTDRQSNVLCKDLEIVSRQWSLLQLSLMAQPPSMCSHKQTDKAICLKTKIWKSWVDTDNYYNSFLWHSPISVLTDRQTDRQTDKSMFLNKGWNILCRQWSLLQLSLMAQTPSKCSHRQTKYRVMLLIHRFGIFEKTNIINEFRSTGMMKITI